MAEKERSMPDDHDAAHSARYLTEAEAAAVLRMSRRSLERWRASGDGPPFTRVGARRVAYSEHALREWAEARTYPHRAAEVVARERTTP
jgi:predicted DNA-binding transcriptional regulator AlpA